ncbi:MAG: hypothetical protein RUMPE_00337 [Eubacteriales bacterium SKADARSKE-1]|nr:hypothetical protein [Eubacteriales bacterium SKADARSKE-1]
MYDNKIAEFYRKVKNDKSFNNKLLKFKNEIKDINIPQERLHKLIKEFILPAAKEKGYNFSEKDLLEYEKQISATNFSKLNQKDLDSVSGGANKLVALSLMALMGTGFASTVADTSGYAMKSATSLSSISSTYSAGWSAFQKFKDSDIKFASNLTNVSYKSTGGRYDSGRLELIFDPEFTENVTISTDDIANILLDNNVDIELASNIDIEICSNADIILDDNLKNTVVSMDISRYLNSVSVRSTVDPSNIFTLSKDEETWLLTLSNPGTATISYEDLVDLARGWDTEINDINSFEVANKGKLEFSPELLAEGWKVSNASSWFGNWKYSKETEKSLRSDFQVTPSGTDTADSKPPAAAIPASKTLSGATSAPKSQPKHTGSPSTLAPNIQAITAAATPTSKTASGATSAPKPQPKHTGSASTLAADTQTTTATIHSPKVVSAATSTSQQATPLATSQNVVNMIGLRNLGNSCFLNSQFQQLYNISHFRNAILSLHDVDPLTQPTIFALQMLFKGMQDASNGDQVAIKELVELPELAIEIMNKSDSGPIYQGNTEDSHETLTKILDRCSEESADLKPIVVEEFNIRGISNISVGGREIISTPSDNGGLQLPIDRAAESQSLKDILTEYFKAEDVEGYELPSGEVRTAQKTFRATQLPNTLALQLKRFSFDVTSSGDLITSKLNNRVEFPENLQLDAEHWGENYQYNLTGVVIHSGSPTGGHYYSYVKDPASENWYKLNDSQVSLVGSFENIKEECFGASQTIEIDGEMYKFENETSAYMLFYSRT